MIHFIFGNYGDNTIALIRWAYENKLSNVSVIHVETGWSACDWQQRVARGQQFAQACGFNMVTLTPKANFVNLVLDRGSFPSVKYQWCASFIKGLPFLSWLDETDPTCEGIIILGSRRADSRARAQLIEFIPESEHYGDRKVWFPLFDHDDELRDALVKRAGFELLHHRSLECNPCIHSKTSDFCRLDQHAIQRLDRLETELNQFMFTPKGEVQTKDIHSVIKFAMLQPDRNHSSLEDYDMGCGSYFACGE
jgi:Phosphoadenosine phosphosulfate reductase family